METKRSFDLIAADVRAAQGGNADAMNRILTDVQDMVYYNCLRMLRNEQNALDASQEILITVYRKLGSLSDPTAYVGWVKRITANHCKNRLCKVNKEFLLSENEEGDDPFASFEDTDEQRVPDKALDNAETRRMIIELIDRLPDEQRMCVMLYYYDEMKTREIAETLGVSEGTVKSRLNYARKSIKEGVQDYEKQGVKLYGLSPVLFLAYFLRASGNATAAPFAIQMSAAGTAAGAATASAAGTGTAATTSASAAGTAAATSGAGTAASATAAAATVAKATGLGAFLATTAGKVVAGFAAAIVLGGVVAGTAVAVNASSPRTRPEPTQSAYVQQQGEDPFAGTFTTSKPAEEQTQPEPAQPEQPTAVPVAPVPVPSDVRVERYCHYEHDVFSSGNNGADTMFSCDLDGDGVEETISYRFAGESWDNRSLTISAGNYRCVLTGEDVESLEGVSGAMVVDLDPQSPYRNLIINTEGEIYGCGVCFVLHPEGDRLVCDQVLACKVFWYGGKVYHETYYSDRLRSHDPGSVRLLGDSLTPDSDWYTWNDDYIAYYHELYGSYGEYFTPRALDVIRDLPCTIDGVKTVIPAGSHVTIYGDHRTEPLVAVKTEDGLIAVIRVEPYETDDWEHWCPYTINGVPQDDYFVPDEESGNYWE